MGRSKAESSSYVRLNWGADYIPKRSKSKRQKRNVFTSYTLVPPNKHNEHYYLGEIWFGTTNNAMPDEWKQCKIHFTSKDDVDKMIMHFESTIVVVSVTNELQFLKDLLSIKIFNVRFKLIDGNVSASLYISNLPLPKFYNKVGNVLKTVFSLIFSISSEYNEINNVKSSATVEHYSELYKNIQKYRESSVDIPKIDVQHPQLKPTLRPYQESAVQWMIHREKKHIEDDMLHPLFEEFVLQSGIKIYFDKHTGFIDLTRPVTKMLNRGGILADEMGLGKTVEVFACILLNPKPSDSSHSQRDQSKMSVNRLEGAPTVDKQSRKHKLPKSSTKPDDYVDSPKKIKVPDNWVKPASKKSATYVALRLWYENLLSGTRENRSRKEPIVQCICGNDEETKDCVVCIDCAKNQHGPCLGYKKRYGPYRCPQCWNNQPPIESKATLIVAPMSLRRQWCEEICKHIRGDLKVLQYGGKSNLATVYPARLTEYDLVITTYNVLQNELRLSENGQVLTLRRQPKYSVPGSPITRIKWWRLCLDEAQTVETPGQMVSVMAQKLYAHHRWAVTGTPVSKDISDLFGLIDYLQFSPYSELDTWNHLLYKPYINGRKDAMHKFLSDILWRTAKTDVIEQINIPRQTTVEHWIEFTAVEKYFYEREHELSSQEFLQKLRNLDLTIPIKTLNRSVLKRIMAPLLALRQACAHHQAVKGRYLATRKQVNSMEDLLNALIAKNILESEDHMRIVISSLNGLAGIYLLLQNPIQAAEEYRKVLQLSARFNKESNDIGLSVDKLQLVHTMHNLSEILGMYPSLPPTLHDDSLIDDCKKIEKEYMERFIRQTIAALESSVKFSPAVTILQAKFVLSPGQWFSDLLDWISTNNLFEDYISRLANSLENANILLENPNERKLLYMLAVWDEDIGKLREDTIAAVNELFDYSKRDAKIIIPDDIVETATDCHLRPQKKSKNKAKRCRVCAANVTLKQYECKLFNMTKKDEDISNTGNWKPAVEEFILKALHSLGKVKNANQEILSDGETHLNILDVLKKEFKEVRKLWTYLDQQICAKDELDMCKIRLRLKDKEQDKDGKQTTADKIMKKLANQIDNKLETIHMLDEHEVDYQRAILHGEEKTNMAALEKTLGTHKYLQTLRNQQISGQHPDPCPICKNVLEKHWNILSCGHCYCLECIQVLLGQTSGFHICCSVCRKKQLIADISYIHTDGKSENAEEVKIKGNYSTKVEAVVKLVMKLKSEDENVKVLVFTNWIVLLKLLKVVFNINGITTETLLQHNFEKNLEAFKDATKNITALLLPINLGSKGLNLIEATHVIFVEPLLNPADELQAIGRIHRIGQTKPTTVHKFFIKHTIEENIYHATSTNAEEWDKNKVTLLQLKKLFVNVVVTETVDVEPDQAGTVEIPQNVSPADNHFDQHEEYVADNSSSIQSIAGAGNNSFDT